MRWGEGSHLPEHLSGGKAHLTPTLSPKGRRGSSKLTGVN